VLLRHAAHLVAIERSEAVAGLVAWMHDAQQSG